MFWEDEPGRDVKDKWIGGGLECSQDGHRRLLNSRDMMTVLMKGVAWGLNRRKQI